MNATQPPLQHGQGQPHDLQPHQQPMIQFQPQQMRGPIMPPAPAGPFQSGPQPSLYPQHRQVPPPNQMMMAQPLSRMMAPNGIPPSAMVPAPIPFPSNARRQPMPPGYPPYIPNGPAPNHSLGHPPMFRPSPGGKFLYFNALPGLKSALRNRVQEPLASDLIRESVLTFHSNARRSREPDTLLVGVSASWSVFHLLAMQ